MSIVDDARVAMKQAGQEIEHLRRVNAILEEALQAVVDSGLLVGPMVLHDTTSEAVHMALKVARSGRA